MKCWMTSFSSGVGSWPDYRASARLRWYCACRWIVKFAQGVPIVTRIGSSNRIKRDNTSVTILDRIKRDSTDPVLAYTINFSQLLCKREIMGVNVFVCISVYVFGRVS